VVRKIVTGITPIMVDPTKPFDFTEEGSKDKAIALAKDLVETMLHAPGIGLAANQIGEPYRVFAFCDLNNEEPQPPKVIFNPVYEGFSQNIVMLEEGCLSFPGLIANIGRPDTIKVKYQDVYGEEYISVVSGMNSRIWQHEIDHLDGILYFNRVPRISRDRALKAWRKQNGFF